jgi:hypothetical protein
MYKISTKTKCFCFDLGNIWTKSKRFYFDIETSGLNIMFLFSILKHLD